MLLPRPAAAISALCSLFSLSEGRPRAVRTQKSISRLPALPNSRSPTWKDTVILSSLWRDSWKHSRPWAGSWMLWAVTAEKSPAAARSSEDAERSCILFCDVWCGQRWGGRSSAVQLGEGGGLFAVLDGMSSLVVFAMQGWPLQRDNLALHKLPRKLPAAATESAAGEMFPPVGQIPLFPGGGTQGDSCG